MKKIVLFSGIMVAAAMSQAAPLTPGAALERALGDTPARLAGKKAAYELRLTRQAEGHDAVYVFGKSDGKGFIVASADDSSPALLGYGTAPVTGADGECAPAFEYWIDALSRQVAYAAFRTSVRPGLRITRPERDPITPQCKTRWNQSLPYNNMCPDDNGSRCVTGCVATAMAQVMKYHNWPVTGTGKTSFFWGSQVLKQDFSEVTFDWDNMLDCYSVYRDSSDEIVCSDSEEEQMAVAMLMKCAGYAVHMAYSPSASGAMSMDIAGALGKYFGYDRSLLYLMRDNYSLGQWEEIIYDTLKEDGPVIYGGQSTLGGHSFVCDGYDRDGYFHFNWGWGGMSDGYFLLDALDPLHQGIGGADGGFDYLQDAVVGIRPARDVPSEWNPRMISQSGLTFTYDADEDALVVSGFVYNSGPVDIDTGRIGMSLTPLGREGDPVYLYEEFEDLKVRYGYRKYPAYLPESIEDGEYLVRAVYSIGDSDFRDVAVPVYGNSSAILTVKGDVRTVTDNDPELPEFTDVAFPSTLTITDGRSPVEMKGTLTNKADTPYLCFLSAVVLNPSMTEVVSNSMPRVYDLDPSESVAVNLKTELIWDNPESFAPGCTIAAAVVIVSTGEVGLLCEPQPVEIAVSGMKDLVDGSSSGDVEEGARVYYTLAGAVAARASAGEARPTLPSGTYIVCGENGWIKIAVR